MQKGDKVAGLLPRNIELLITVFATWRIGAVYQPLFTASGPKAIEHRLNSSDAKVVVTDAVNRQNSPKSWIARPSSPSAVPKVRHRPWRLQGFWAELANYSSVCEPVLLDG